MMIRTHSLLLVLVIFLFGCKRDPSIKRPTALAEMVLVEGGTFQTGGDTAYGIMYEQPIRQITVSSFWIEKYEVTFEKWSEVRAWAENHGYIDLTPGQNGRDIRGVRYNLMEAAWSEVPPWGMEQGYLALKDDDWWFGDPRLAPGEISALDYLRKNASIEREIIAHPKKDFGYKSLDANNPVTMVDVIDIIKWCNARSEMEGLEAVYYTDSTHKNVYRMGHARPVYDGVKWDADGYRIPIEAEWIFAARGGVHSRHYRYSGSDRIADVAWYADNADSKTHAVGLKTPNELGIYDMSGNVTECVLDNSRFYTAASNVNPRPSAGLIFGNSRGGCGGVPEINCRITAPSGGGATRWHYSGFRCVKAVPMK